MAMGIGRGALEGARHWIRKDMKNTLHSQMNLTSFFKRATYHFPSNPSVPHVPGLFVLTNNPTSTKTTTIDHTSTPAGTILHSILFQETHPRHPGCRNSLDLLSSTSVGIRGRAVSERLAVSGAGRREAGWVCSCG